MRSKNYVDKETYSAPADQGTNIPEETSLRERRSLLKVMGVMPLLYFPLSASAAELQHIHQPPAAAPIGPPEIVTLSKAEQGTLKELADWIIPADERSGSASEAGVMKFIEDWLVFHEGNDLATIRGGLMWLERTCFDAYGQSFVDCSSAQQQAVIERIAWPGHSEPADLAGEIFFSKLRDLVTGAFFSTETGIRDLPFLGNQVLQEWTGCPDDVLAKLGL